MQGKAVVSSPYLDTGNKCRGRAVVSSLYLDTGITVGEGCCILSYLDTGINAGEGFSILSLPGYRDTWGKLCPSLTWIQL
jgi:hypothetical protein